MYHLTQYIVVRRDLPLENIPVYAAHAVGIASFAWGAMLREQGHAEASWHRLNPDYGFPSRIVRGSKNEARLKKLALELTAVNVKFFPVIEPDEGPFKGQLMALALLPCLKEDAPAALNDFQNLRYRDVPDFIARGGKVDKADA